MSDARGHRRCRIPPSRAMLAVAALALGLVVPAGAVLSTPGATADTACEWVTIRVERPGSPPYQRCVEGTPGTGLDALRAAGEKADEFKYTPVPGQAGMVCTIGGYPDPCNGAPADAYWSYWHADAGATSWTYATRGAGNRKPPPGSHDAWVFGDGSVPPSSPPPAPTPTESPPPAGDDDPAADGSSDDGPDPTSGENGSSDSDPSTRSSSGSGGSSGGDPGGSSTDTAPSQDSTAGRSDGAGSVAPADDEQGTAAPADDAAGDLDADNDADDNADDDGDAAGDLDADADREDASTIDGREDTSGDDEPVASEPLDDTVTVEARGGGRSGAGAVVGGVLVLGLAVAGVLRARTRRSDLDGTQ